LLYQLNRRKKNVKNRKLPITIPAGVSINVNDKTNEVTVKGPKGELKQWVDTCISFEIK
jgi:large subunit ribosomal protein L6